MHLALIFILRHPRLVLMLVVGGALAGLAITAYLGLSPAAQAQASLEKRLAARVLDHCVRTDEKPVGSVVRLMCSVDDGGQTSRLVLFITEWETEQDLHSKRDADVADLAAGQCDEAWNVSGTWAYGHLACDSDPTLGLSTVSWTFNGQPVEATGISRGVDPGEQKALIDWWVANHNFLIIRDAEDGQK